MLSMLSMLSMLPMLSMLSMLPVFRGCGFLCYSLTFTYLTVRLIHLSLLLPSAINKIAELIIQIEVGFSRFKTLVSFDSMPVFIWFSRGTHVSTTNEADGHDTTEILLKMS